MKSQFNQQVVWITGASSGIGAALAAAFSAAGAFVILSARRRAPLERLAAGLPHQTLVLPIDLCDPDAIAPAAERALAWRGRVDVLVNNAGVSQRSQIQHTLQATARRLMEVNFFGATALTAAVLPAMLARRRGHIVNLTSVASYVAAPDRAFYSASKHALRAWSSTLRSELSGTGVNVTMVCPGFVHTDISHNALSGDGAALQRADPQVAAGMSPDEVAQQVLPAVARRERELRLGGVEILAIYWERFAPWIVAWVLPSCVPQADGGPWWVLRRALRAVWGLPAPQRLRQADSRRRHDRVSAHPEPSQR